MIFWKYLLHNPVLALLPAATALSIFDYLDTDLIDPEKAAKRESAFWVTSQQTAEPLRTCIEPNRLAADMTGIGLRLKEYLCPAAIQERYFVACTGGYQSFKHAHLVAAVVE